MNCPTVAMDFLGAGLIVTNDFGFPPFANLPVCCRALGAVPTTAAPVVVGMLKVPLL